VLRTARPGSWAALAQSVTRLLEQLVGARNNGGAAKPGLQHIQIGTSVDALTLRRRNSQPARIEHVEYIGSPARGATAIDTLADEFLDDFFCFRMHFESLFSGIAESGGNERQI
jgi:hypothetical protein